MVDHAEYIIGVFDNQKKLRSGTAQTVNYALHQGKVITLIHPDTCLLYTSVREHFDGMYLSHDAAKGVIETYGMERVALVLANTVQLQDWDGRYSRRNKEWAKTIPRCV